MAAVVCASAVPAASAAELRWPEVAPLERSHRFEPGQEHALALVLPGRDGEPLYRLCCAAPLTAAPCGAADVFSGLFMCTLRPAAGGPDLLVENPFPRASWETRARFLHEELSSGRTDDACGPARRFRLRGMTLTLTLRDATFRARALGADPGAPLRALTVPLLDAFTLAVRVDPDPAALGAHAEPRTHVVTAGVPRPSAGDEDLRGTDRCLAARIPGRLTAADAARLGLAGPYPRVRPATLRHRLDLGAHAPAGAASATGTGPVLPPLVLRDAGGREAYRLTGHWSVDPGAPGVWFRLTKAGSAVDLLGEGLDPVTRRSRAYFALDDLDGACARYPGWGARREFRLQGLRVVIELAAPRLQRADGPPRSQRADDAPRLAPDDWGATIVVEVEPDEGATSPFAGPSADLDPRLGPGCTEPVRVPGSVRPPGARRADGPP